MDEHDIHSRTSHPDHNEMTHRRGRGCATEEEPSLFLLCGWACETERESAVGWARRVSLPDRGSWHVSSRWTERS